MNFELSEFLGLKEKLRGLETERTELRDTLARTAHELGTAKAELRRSHETRVKLELELAAAKYALSEDKLEQDNTVLRGLVTRLNEELQQYRPMSRRAAARFAARARSWRNDVSIFRWPWSRRLVIRETQRNPT